MWFPVFSVNITSNASQLVIRVLKYFEEPMYDRLMSDINKHQPVFQPTNFDKLYVYHLPPPPPQALSWCTWFIFIYSIKQYNLGAGVAWNHHTGVWCAYWHVILIHLEIVSMSKHCHSRIQYGKSRSRLFCKTYRLNLNGTILYGNSRNVRGLHKPLTLQCAIVYYIVQTYWWSTPFIRQCVDNRKFKS